MYIFRLQIFFTDVSIICFAKRKKKKKTCSQIQELRARFENDALMDCRSQVFHLHKQHKMTQKNTSIYGEKVKKNKNHSRNTDS